MKIKKLLFVIFWGLSVSIISCSKEDDLEGAETGDEFYEEIVPAPAKEYYDDLTIWTYNTAFLEADYRTLTAGRYGHASVNQDDAPEWFYELTGFKRHHYLTNRIGLEYILLTDDRESSIDFTVPRENVRIAAVKANFYEDSYCCNFINTYIDRQFDEVITSWSDENLCDFEIKDGKTVNIRINNTEAYGLYYFYLEADPTEEEWNQGYRTARCVFFIELNTCPLVGDPSINPDGTWEGC